jgi:hypothetical protein
MLPSLALNFGLSCLSLLCAEIIPVFATRRDFQKHISPNLFFYTLVYFVRKSHCTYTLLFLLITHLFGGIAT